jgi:hypothetical protein
MYLVFRQPERIPYSVPTQPSSLGGRVLWLVERRFL